VTPNDDGTYLVAGDKESGTRGLIGVRPSGETEIGASEVEDFAAFCDKKGVDVRVMATRGRFTTGARSAADAGDVHLLDPNELASAVRDEGVEELVGKFTGGGGGGSLFDSLPFPVPSGLPKGCPSCPSRPPSSSLAAVFAGRRCSASSRSSAAVVAVVRPTPARRSRRCRQRTRGTRRPTGRRT